MDMAMTELEDLKYEYEKAMRVKVNLEKNLERRKKLNLLDNVTEEELRGEIAEASRNLEDMRRRVRSMESEKTRSRVIADTHEHAPWE